MRSIKTIITALFLLMVSEAFGQHNFVYVENGRLYFPDGKELSLWGVNLQPCLSWEYNFSMKPAGIAWNKKVAKDATNRSLDELQLMNCQLIRCHLTPADFTDDKGNLINTLYLEMLDYMIAQAKKRGMYLSFSFLNHMGHATVPNSFMNQYTEWKDRPNWIFDKTMVAKSKNYIKQLLNRVNPYTKKAYKSDPSIVTWEIINEPTYFKYSEIKKSVASQEYENWLKISGKTDSITNFKHFREALVLQYINRIYDEIRATGCKHPVIWNCNWHRMIIDHEDVFSAVEKSKAEVVSFCNYPGQDLVPSDYWEFRKDLSHTDFSNWLWDAYNNRDWYGWTRDAGFKSKAKVVYEFETFFNQSAYLYAAQAKLFRSLGVQMATMWRYTMPINALHNNLGSHFLNLKCTPRKAASFMVAKEIFNATPLYDTYVAANTTELVTQNYMFSYKKDVCIFSSPEKFIYSNSFVDENYPKISAGVKQIIGYGTSPYVTYNGTGVYFINYSNGKTKLNIMPNCAWLKEPWLNNDGKNLVVALTNPDKSALKLNFSFDEQK